QQRMVKICPNYSLFSLITATHHSRIPPRFPYTTLFRSRRDLDRRAWPRVRIRDRARIARHTARRAERSGGHPRLLLVGQCADRRSEEHTSELQSRGHFVCRLLLEIKNPPSRSDQRIACN